MKMKMLFCRKGEPDKAGEVYGPKVVEKLRDYVEGPNPIVTLGFDMEKPIGRATEIVETESEVFLEIEISRENAERLGLTGQIDHLSVAAPAGTMTRSWEQGQPLLENMDLKVLGALPWEKSLWGPDAPG